MDGDRLHRKLAELQGKIKLQVKQHESILSQLEGVRKNMQNDLAHLASERQNSKFVVQPVPLARS